MLCWSEADYQNFLGLFSNSVKSNCFLIQSHNELETHDLSYHPATGTLKQKRNKCPLHLKSFYSNTLQLSFGFSVSPVIKSDLPANRHLDDSFNPSIGSTYIYKCKEGVGFILLVGDTVSEKKLLVDQY